MKRARDVVPARFRHMALALPGAVEGAHQGTADFRVGKRIYATLGYPDDAWGMVKLTPEQQSMLVEAEPEIFRPVPGGWGKQGYTNVLLAKADATTLQSALTMAWKNVAPNASAKRRAIRSSRVQKAILISHRINPERPDRSLFERASAIGLRLNCARYESCGARAREDNSNPAEDRMRKLTQFVLPACLSMLASAALAVDRGQYDHVPSDIRAWFKSVIAPNGVPCCDISDGHRTTYDVRAGAYWVPIEGQWMAVPDRAVIRDQGNPIGEAVVWYVHHRGSIIISCFVPADAV